MRKQNYLLIFDTGDLVFNTQKEAMEFVKYLKKKGHRIDRLQTYHGMSNIKPRIIKEWKRYK